MSSSRLHRPTRSASKEATSNLPSGEARPAPSADGPAAVAPAEKHASARAAKDALKAKDKERTKRARAERRRAREDAAALADVDVEVQVDVQMEAEKVAATSRRARATSAASSKPPSPPERERAAPAEGVRVPRTLLRRSTRVTDIDPRAPIERGARVRVLDGPFAGRAGVVQALDEKGEARVALGALLVRVEVRDLVVVAEGRGRPALSSSHRRRPGTGS